MMTYVVCRVHEDQTSQPIREFADLHKAVRFAYGVAGKGGCRHLRLTPWNGTEWRIERHNSAEPVYEAVGQGGSMDWATYDRGRQITEVIIRRSEVDGEDRP